jgi:hypothetical protein
MLEAAPLRQGIRPPFLRRTSSTPAMKPLPGLARSHPGPSGDFSEVREVHDDDVDAAASTFSAEGPLFCRYAVSLQNSVRMPLDLAFTPGGSNRCPECSAHLVVERGRAWKIVKEIVREVTSTPEYDEEQVEERTFLLSNRFVIKCHRERVGFACVLCARFRDRDTIVASTQGLVRHVWRKHDVDEYEAEPDIREIELV